jgi:hypothetical protein
MNNMTSIPPNNTPGGPTPSPKPSVRFTEGPSEYPKTPAQPATAKVNSVANKPAAPKRSGKGNLIQRIVVWGNSSERRAYNGNMKSLDKRIKAENERITYLEKERTKHQESIKKNPDMEAIYGNGVLDNFSKQLEARVAERNRLNLEKKQIITERNTLKKENRAAFRKGVTTAPKNFFDRSWNWLSTKFSRVKTAAAGAAETATQPAKSKKSFGIIRRIVGFGASALVGAATLASMVGSELRPRVLSRPIEGAGGGRATEYVLKNNANITVPASAGKCIESQTTPHYSTLNCADGSSYRTRRPQNLAKTPIINRIFRHIDLNPYNDGLGVNTTYVSQKAAGATKYSEFKPFSGSILKKNWNTLLNFLGATR